jgi:DNA-binding transcriptional LysR family regulator
MDLKQLRYFLAVAEEGHFGRAAQRVHIVQPALSMQIRALEESLGTSLFKRTTRRVELTEAGSLFRVEAERAIAQVERAKLVAQRAARGEIGTLRIGFAGNAAFAGVLSGNVRSFHARYSNVQIELREMAPLIQAAEIAAGRLDLGYSPVFGGAVDSRLAVDPVGSWRWLVAIARDHPLAASASLAPKSLAKEPFIVYAAHGADVGQLEHVHQVLGREPLVAHRAANTLTVLTMVAAGLGVALVPQPLSVVRIAGLAYRPLTGFSQRSELVLLSRASETSGAVKAFLTLVRAQSAQNRARRTTQ